MANAGIIPTPNFENEFRHWYMVNHPNAAPLTDLQVRASYDATAAVPYTPPSPDPQPPVPQAPTAIGNMIKPVTRPPLGQAPQQRHLHLLAPVPGVPVAQLGGPNWKGIKHLGTGGGGSVTMWEWNGPPAGRPAVHDRIAIKSQRDPGPALLEEGRKMVYLNQANHSDHIVKLLVNPPTQITPAMVAAQHLHIDWLNGGAPGAGFARRLVMEYLSQGSLQDLREMRVSR
ncbi:hypothetical protein ONS96_000928 [Cadophora gregata f. sp. sojae]|nr:hypothetical protein ONS96_000928 [Cadophora gregata f. sp. sojae]